MGMESRWRKIGDVLAKLWRRDIDEDGSQITPDRDEEWGSELTTRQKGELKLGLGERWTAEETIR